MAITTLSGLIGGLITPVSFTKNSTGNPDYQQLDVYQTYWGQTGFPKAGAYDTTLNGVTLSGSTTNVVGQIPYKDPASGNGYVAKISASATQVNSSGTLALGGTGRLILCDRLWHNGGIATNITTAQTIVSPTWPARDISGATSGDGVFLALEFSSGQNANATFTVSYTNSAGTSGRTGTSVTQLSNTETMDVFPVYLQAGDTGVQSVQSFTWNTAPGVGTVNLVAYRPVAILTLKNSKWGSSVEDAVQLGFPRIYNGSVLYWMWDGFYAGSGATDGLLISGTITFAQG